MEVPSQGVDGLFERTDSYPLIQSERTKVSQGRTQDLVLGISTEIKIRM